MSFPVIFPFDRLTNSGQSAAIQLQLLYSATINKQQWDFVSRFDHVLQEDTPSQQPLPYQSASHEEGTLTDEEVFRIMGLRTSLDQSTGTYMFWFKVPGPTIQPALLFESETKALLYDPRTRILSLNRTDTNGIANVWSHPLPSDTNTWIHIGVSWSPESTSLYINGDGPGDLPQMNPTEGESNP